MKIEKEIWKPVVGYEGLYEISNLGRLKRLQRVVNGGHNQETNGRTLKEKIIKPYPYKSYSRIYLGFILYKNGKPKHKLLHRLLGETFIENPNNLPEIDHMKIKFHKYNK